MKYLVMTLMIFMNSTIAIAETPSKNVEVVFLQNRYRVCIGDDEVDSVFIGGRLLLQNNTERSVAFESGALRVVRVFKGLQAIDLFDVLVGREKVEKHEVKAGKTFVLSETFEIMLFANRKSGKLAFLFDYGEHTIPFVLGGTLRLLNNKYGEDIKLLPFKANFTRGEPSVCQ